MSENKLVILRNPLSNDLSQNIEPDGARQNIVLNVGRLTVQKGQDILIKGFANLNPTNWKLIIVGEGPKRAEYQKLIDDLGMRGKIFLPGQTKNISQHYNKAKIFAFTSHFEGFPNALTEAMFMGLSCVSTDCPTGPNELIKDGENGFLIEVNNQKALQEKLYILMNDNELIKTYSIAARNSVQEFKAENVAEAWKKTISSAMG